MMSGYTGNMADAPLRKLAEDEWELSPGGQTMQRKEYSPEGGLLEDFKRTPEPGSSSPGFPGSTLKSWAKDLQLLSKELETVLGSYDLGDYVEKLEEIRRMVDTIYQNLPRPGDE